MVDELRNSKNGASNGESPAPGIRRGRGLELSIHTPADDRAAVPPPAAVPPRRGRGLQLSTNLQPPGDRAAGVGDLGALAPLQRIGLAHGQVCYRQSGEGPPLLLLHGWGASSRYWFSTQARLADRHTSYALDLPGFGASPALGRPGGIARLAELTIEFADALGLAEFDLNGHSFGGAVATYIAAHWPTRVRRLVITAFGVRRSAIERTCLSLAHAPAELALQLGQPLIDLWRPLQNQARPITELLMSAPPIPDLLAGWYLNRAPEDRRLLREGIADLLDMDLGAHLACVISIGDPVVVDALGRLCAPALFVGGAADRVIPADDLRAAAELARARHVQVIEQCGHVPMIEQPEAYHTALRQFLAES